MTLKFIEPILRKAKNRWYVEYYFEGKRKVIRVERIHRKYKVKEAEAMIKEMVIAPLIVELNKHLYPNVKKEEVKESYGTTFNDLITVFLKTSADKFNSSDSCTLQVYTSNCNTIKKYLKKQTIKELNLVKFAEEYKTNHDIKDTNNYLYYPIKHFTLAQAKKMIEDYRSNHSVTSSNFFLNFMRGVFNFAIENEYLEKNVFHHIKKQKNEKREYKRVLKQSELDKITTHLQKNDVNYYRYLQFIYTLLLRPVEITRLQIKDFDFENRLFKINGTKTKNRKERVILIPNDLWDKEKEFFNSIRKKNPDYYIFSEDGLKVGKSKIINTNTLSQKWKKMTKELNLPDDCLQYGLRHTGISKMLSSNLSSNTVMMHADHSNIEMTSHYGRHFSEEVEENIRKGVKAL